MMRFVTHHYLRTTHHGFHNLLWPHFSSLRYNNLGAEGGKAIGEALKVNRSITNIE